MRLLKYIYIYVNLDLKKDLEYRLSRFNQKFVTSSFSKSILKELTMGIDNLYVYQVINMQSLVKKLIQGGFIYDSFLSFQQYRMLIFLWISDTMDVNLFIYLLLLIIIHVNDLIIYKLFLPVLLFITLQKITLPILT